jgi:hypothetical protein
MAKNMPAQETRRGRPTRARSAVTLGFAEVLNPENESGSSVSTRFPGRSLAQTSSQRPSARNLLNEELGERAG